MYVLKRDSKTIFEYYFKLSKASKHSINMADNFEHGFQYIQTPSNRLFMIGGGKLDHTNPKLVANLEFIFNKGTNTLDIVARALLKHPRHGHSITFLETNFLIVTGSRVNYNNAH